MKGRIAAKFAVFKELFGKIEEYNMCKCQVMRVIRENARIPFKKMSF